MPESSKLQLTELGSENNDQNPRETLGNITKGVNTIASQVFTQQNGAGKRQERSEKFKREIIETPQEVLDFRKGFVNGIETTEDVTKEKLKKIAEIGDKLDRSGNFHFEKSDYGNIGVVLELACLQEEHNSADIDFYLQIECNYCDYSYWRKYTQDLVHNEAMPGLSKEDDGIVEKAQTRTRFIKSRPLKGMLCDVSRRYCDRKGIFFKDEDNYMLLYMYLMGSNGGFGRLGEDEDKKGFSYSYVFYDGNKCSYGSAGDTDADF